MIKARSGWGRFKILSVDLGVVKRKPKIDVEKWETWEICIIYKIPGNCFSFFELHEVTIDAFLTMNHTVADFAI